MIHANGQWKSKRAFKDACTPKPCIEDIARAQDEGRTVAWCYEHGRPILGLHGCRAGRGVTVDSLTNPSIFGSGDVPQNGTFPVVGPSAYDRKWYANVTVSNGRIVKVK